MNGLISSIMSRNLSHKSNFSHLLSIPINSSEKAVLQSSLNT